MHLKMFDSNLTNSNNQDLSISNHEKSILSDSEDDEKISANASFKAPTEIQISYKDDLIVGQINPITVYNLPNDTEGKVRLHDSSTEKNYSIDLVNGRGSIDLKMEIPYPSGDLGPELYNYYIEAWFEWDDAYESSYVDAFFRVNKYVPDMQMHFTNIEVGEDALIRFTLAKDANGIIGLSVNDKYYEAEVKNGLASVVLQGLAKGKYNLTAAYRGDEKYDWAYADGVLTVYGDGVSKNLYNENTAGNKKGIDLCNHIAGNPLIALLFSLMVLISLRIRV